MEVVSDLTGYPVEMVKPDMDIEADLGIDSIKRVEILSAMEDAKARGEGATVYKGRLVDIASIKQAEVIVRQSEMIAG